MVAFLVPMGLQGLRAAAPYAMRYGTKPAGKAIKYGLGAIRNYFRPGSKIVKVPGPTTGKGAINFKVPSRNAPPQFQNKPMFSIGGTNPANMALQTGITAAATAPFAYDYLTSEAEQSANTPPPAGSGGPVDTVPDPVKPKDKKEQPKDDVKITSDQIKSGELDDFIKERIDLFKKYIGDDTRKRTKTAGYNAMVQFGLNLATKRGNLVEGIAESAKEPLKEFAKLGNDLMDRAASIEKAGIEAGVSAYEKSEDRKIDEKALATELLKEKLKQDAKTLTRGEFITGAMNDIMGNENLMRALSDPYYKDGKRDPNAPTDMQLAEMFAQQQYNTYRAVELPPGAAGQELLDSLPSGTLTYDSQTGLYNEKP